MDWNLVFALSKPPLELIVRGTLTYWFLFAIFRTILKRDVGAVGVADVLLLVIVADAAQNALADDYRSVTDGMILISTIVGWNVLFDWLAYRYPRLRRLLQPRELCLVKDGRILHHNLRKEFMSVDELEAKLREQGWRTSPRSRWPTWKAKAPSASSSGTPPDRTAPRAPLRNGRSSAGGAAAR